MGTSSGGAGGGSGGSAGRGYGGAGFVTVHNFSLVDVNPDEAKTWEAIQSVFSRLSQDYITFFSGDDGVIAAYEALHTLHVLLVLEKSWGKVQERFGVSEDPGCLRVLADVLSREDGPSPVNPRLSAPLKAALMDFFLRVVGDDPVIRDGGTAQQVITAAQTSSAFQSASALFLAAYTAEVLRQEETGLTKLARRRLRDFSEAKANQVVASFKTKFIGKSWNDIKQVSYPHLFRVIKGERQWLSEQLRKNIRNQAPALNAL